MFLYAISHIDFWPGWMTETEFLASLDEEWNSRLARHRYEEQRAKALTLARRRGWEGDFAVGLLIAGIPPGRGDTWGKWIYGWKQSSNGTTFIASPYRLPWLEEDGPPISG